MTICFPSSEVSLRYLYLNLSRAPSAGVYLLLSRSAMLKYAISSPLVYKLVIASRVRSPT